MTRSGQGLRLADFCFRVWLLPMMSCWIAGCGGFQGSPISDGSVGATTSSPLRIAAASDLQVALPKLGDRFLAKGGIAIAPTFLSSGVLAQHIKQGAPYDV